MQRPAAGRSPANSGMPYRKACLQRISVCRTACSPQAVRTSGNVRRSRKPQKAYGRKRYAAHGAPAPFQGNCLRKPQQTACRRAHALIKRRTKDKPLYFRRNAARCRRTALNAAYQRKTAYRAPKAPCGKAVRHRHASSAAGFRAGAVRSSPSDRGEHPRHKASPPQTIQPPETPGSGRRENRSPSRSSGREAENSRSMISRGKQPHGSSSGGGAEKLLALP